MNKLPRNWFFLIVALIVLLGLQLRLQAVRYSNAGRGIRPVRNVFPGPADPYQRSATE